MFRYTIIHHDIREYYKLSMNEYAVCDSYHQLSHQFPTDKSPDEIGEFLGLSRSTVFDARNTLVEKGLLEQHKTGWKTTQRWATAVTEKNPNSGQSVRKSDSESETRTVTQYITKEVIKNEAKASEESSLEDDVSLELEEELVPTRELLRGKKNKSVEPKVQELWKLWPGPHSYWQKNNAIRAASKALIDDYGFEKVKWAVEFWVDNRTDKFCPDISTPVRLADKWESLRQYRYTKYGY